MEQDGRILADDVAAEDGSVRGQEELGEAMLLLDRTALRSACLRQGLGDELGARGLEF